MATRKRTGVADFIWVNYVDSLQTLAANDFASQFFYNGLVMTTEIKLFDVNAFCTAAQPTFTEPVAADFLSGAWKAMYLAAVDKANYYYWCEEY